MVCRLLLSYKLQGKLILKIQSFPEVRGTLFTCVPILVYIYIYIIMEFVLYMTTYPVCLLYREILCLECQPNTRKAARDRNDSTTFHPICGRQLTPRMRAPRCMGSGTVVNRARCTLSFHIFRIFPLFYIAQLFGVCKDECWLQKSRQYLLFECCFAVLIPHSVTVQCNQLCYM